VGGEERADVCEIGQCEAATDQFSPDQAKRPRICICDNSVPNTVSISPDYWISSITLCFLKAERFKETHSTYFFAQIFYYRPF